ncbi:LysM peptidoglycan-binding domain-containing protein [Actinomycetaceae bacterium TAE3-ERU4]|nr:LysM peptidoglycan-binding domain-containing protein [Actinomycetaceae bacterium TAE3-ERU4]
MSVQRVAPAVDVFTKPRLRVVGGTDFTSIAQASRFSKESRTFKFEADFSALNLGKIDWNLLRRVLFLLVVVVFLFVLSVLVIANLFSFSGQTVSYIVSSGDSLWGIAQRYSSGRSVSDTLALIREINGIYGDALVPGQSLLIPLP